MELKALLDELEALEDEVTLNCTCGHFGLSSFGSSVLSAITCLYDALRKNADLSGVYATKFSGHELGHEFMKEIHDIAVSAGAIPKWKEYEIEWDMRHPMTQAPGLGEHCRNCKKYSCEDCGSDVETWERYE